MMNVFNINNWKILNYLRKHNSSLLSIDGCEFDGFFGGTIVKPYLEIHHFSHMNPSDSQGQLPSCAGHALCNYLEYIIRMSGEDKELRRGWQLDGRRVWLNALIPTGRVNTGLTTKELIIGNRGKILPENASYRIIQRSEIFNILRKRPLYTSMKISTNWSFANRKNGFIRPGGNFRENHAVILSGCSAINDTHGPFVHFLNSWGRDNGVDGIVTLDWNNFSQNLNHVFDINFNIDEFLESKKWKEYVIYP